MKITEQDGLRILTPETPDNWLINGETYSREVYLGNGDNGDRWHEVASIDFDIDDAEFGKMVKEELKLET